VPPYIFAVLAAGWIVWMTPFLLARHGGAAQTLDRRARWGIAIQAIGFAIVWMNHYGEEFRTYQRRVPAYLPFIR